MRILPAVGLIEKEVRRKEGLALGEREEVGKDEGCAVWEAISVVLSVGSSTKVEEELKVGRALGELVGSALGNNVGGIVGGVIGLEVGAAVGVVDALRKVGTFVTGKIILLDSIGKEEVDMVDFSLSILLACCSLYINNKQEKRHQNLCRV